MFWLFTFLVLGRAHIRQSVPCLRKFDPQFDYCERAVCAQARHALSALAQWEEVNFGTVQMLSVFNLGEFVFVGGGEHVIETEGAVRQDGLYKGNLKGT